MDNKRSFFLQILVILGFSIVFWYSLVFAGISWKIEWKTSENIFVNSLNLREVSVYISSNIDISNATISGDCQVYWKLIQKVDKLFVFNISFLDNNCNKSKAIVNFNNKDFSLTTTFNIFSDTSLYSTYLDYSTLKLEGLLNTTNLARKNFETKNEERDLKYFENVRKTEEIDFLAKFIDNIISKREQKYSSPLKWVSLPTKSNRLPNTARPYRASYTTWVHEGWDFYADFWTPVQALDYWVVLRVVKDFGFSDLDKVKKAWNLTERDKLWNLDILRGNQVWLKTMKWDIVFYAHLDEVYDNIKEGTVVFKGQPLGTIWISWVPDQNYTDYHVHLEIRENPYTPIKAPYTFEDYMAWPWYFKGQKESYVLENQKKIFE